VSATDWTIWGSNFVGGTVLLNPERSYRVWAPPSLPSRVVSFPGAWGWSLAYI